MGREVRLDFESKLRFDVTGHVQDLTHVHASSSDCLNRESCFVEQVPDKLVAHVSFVQPDLGRKHLGQMNLGRMRRGRLGRRSSSVSGGQTHEEGRCGRGRGRGRDHDVRHIGFSCR